MSKQRTQYGFSLIELLLAIFILGIGIISIATLFPAGIAQQQKTADDIIGPIVARNAMTVIRSRVNQDDFGGCELRPIATFDLETSAHGFVTWVPQLCGTAFLPPTQTLNPWPTICGDWMWRRPGMFTSNFGEDDDPIALNLRGAIDIFAVNEATGFGGGDVNVLTEYWTDIEDLPGIPYNREKYPDFYTDEGDWNGLHIPVKRILASERQYPMWYGNPEDRPEAQYYWDCMFRRFEGRILVGIFVYRVIDPSESGSYIVDTTDLTNPDLPRRVNLSTESSGGSWSANVGNEILYGTQNDDPTEIQNHWHFPGQWIIDQNGNIHHVQRGRRRANDDYEVTLSSRSDELVVFESIQNGGEGVNVNWWDKSLGTVNQSGFVADGVVTDIWFMPISDSLGRRLVPVFATVQEL